VSSIIRVARHGETDWNREGRYQGRLDSKLSEIGRLQASALAQALSGAGITQIVSSPLSRCLDTARPLAERIGIPVETDDRLIEIAHGVWENRLRDEIRINDPERLFAWKNDPANVSFPNGESLVQVRERWRDFANMLGAQTQSDSILIVTHDVIARIAILEATGRELDDLWKPRVLNGAYAEYDVTGGTWRLVHECCDSHLNGLTVDIATQAL